jgi:hypothetical protein
MCEGDMNVIRAPRSPRFIQHHRLDKVNPHQVMKARPQQFVSGGLPLKQHTLRQLRNTHRLRFESLLGDGTLWLLYIVGTGCFARKFENRGGLPEIQRFPELVQCESHRFEHRGRPLSPPLLRLVLGRLPPRVERQRAVGSHRFDYAAMWRFANPDRRDPVFRW